MAGLLPISNPFAQWVDPRRNALMGFGAGMLSGDPGAAMRYAMQGAGIDRQVASDMQKQAQAEQERNATMEWVKANAPQFATLPPAMAFEAAMKQMAQAQSGATAAPANVREWEYFTTLAPEQQDQYLRMKRANPYLDLGTGFGQPDPTNPGALAGPVIPKDVQGEAQLKAAGGVLGANEADKTIQAPIQEANLVRLDAQTDNVIKTIDKATGQTGWGETGLVGAVAGAIPGTTSYDLRQTVQTIKANLGFAELQAMRDASPTGGALGQVAVQELEALQSTLASLDPNQSEEQLKANLATVRDLLERQKMYRRAASEAKYSSPQSAPAGVGADYKSKYGLE